MRPIADQTIAITGATGGLGRAVAARRRLRDLSERLTSQPTPR